MNFKDKCPVCDFGLEKLTSFNWSDFIVIHCNKCGLDYCSSMTEKETGGNSSPVHIKGIEMMASSFHKTKKLAVKYTNSRVKIYEAYLNKKCSSILEIGCGPGVFYAPFKEKNIEWDGIDINPYWKLFGEKNNVPISDIPLDQIDKKYDVIMAYQVLEHVENPISFMTSILSKLKSGGIIHLELPNQNSLNSRIRRISSLISYDYGFVQPPMHLRAYQKMTLEYLFKSIGLQTKKVFTCSNTDEIWGQVRDYNSLQNSYYTFTGKVKLGSLLIGLAKNPL